MDDNNNIKKAPNIPPFLRYCSAIIPTAFDDSLSYYEALCALYKYLQDNIVNVINNNATVTEYYINLVKELKSYVENYFDNLDVQEEINNKLDEMAEDGTLADIIANFISSGINIYAPNLGTSGDLTIMQITKNNEVKNCIIDFGSYSESAYQALVTFLVNKNISKFDYAFVSHYHNDHVGCLSYLIADNRFDFSDCVFYLPTTPDYSQFVGSTRYIPTNENNIKQLLNDNNIHFTNPSDDTVLSILDATITFYNSDLSDFTDYYNVTTTYPSETGTTPVTVYNNFSMVMQVEQDDNRILFTGDIEHTAEANLATKKLNTPTILKVEHHGYNTSVDKDYYNIVRTSDVLFAMRTNDEGLIQDYVCSENGTILTTSDSGDITINCNPYGFVYKGENGTFAKANRYYSLGNIAELLPIDADLDDYVDGGIYQGSSASHTPTYSNCPETSHLVKLRVEKLTLNRAIQYLYAVGVDIEWVRTYQKGSGWTSWRLLNTGGHVGTLTETDDLNSIPMGSFSASAAIASNIGNVPSDIGNRRFVVTTEYLANDDNALYQVLRIVDADEYERYERQKTSLGWGEWYRFANEPLLIPKNTDLNNVVKSGEYCSTGSAYSSTYSNVPGDAGSYAFNMIVRKGTSANDRYIQEITTIRSPMKVYKRVKASGGWSTWYEITMSAVS